MLDALHLDPEQEIDRISTFIAHNAQETGIDRAVLGVSGGVDSALVAALCARALGPENVYGMLLPYETSNPQSAAHGRMVTKQLGISSSLFEITPMVAPLVARDPAMSGVRKGNIMARCRMIALYDQSAAWNGLVMATGNRTETLLGYFTMYGDSAAALRPISHLYKCQVRALATHLGLPPEIVAKAPSADLWAGQTDEDELGFTYDDADQILYLLTEAGLTEAEMAAEGFAPATIQAIQRRMVSSAFKLQEPGSLPTMAATDVAATAVAASRTG
jgi:NAD+ synthase